MSVATPDGAVGGRNEDTHAQGDATSTTVSQAAQRDTLYYDGQCPLCAGEISKLREIRGDSLQLVDIHAGDDLPGMRPRGSTSKGAGGDTGPRHMPSRDALLRTLHLRRSDGRWLTGADANVAAWEGTAMEKRLRPLRWPVLRHAVDLGYALWAKWRYWRLYGKQYDEGRHAPDQTGH